MENRNGKRGPLQDEAINQITDGLDQLDKSFSISTPDIQWFEQVVNSNQQKLKRRLIKETILFLALASVILSGILFTLLEMPIVFLLIQFLAVTFIIFYSRVRYYKQVNET